MAVITALTAQNTQRVLDVHLPPGDFVAAQIDAVFDDVEVHAVKIGMLGSGHIARVVADRLKVRSVRSIVLDPVLVATSGDALATDDLVDIVRDKLFPLATLITPNLPEAARLANCAEPRATEEMRQIAERLHGLGARAVLVKGGHLTGPEATDVLFDGKSHRLFTQQRVPTAHATHGTGCTLASAITTYLARGFSLDDAIGAAKRYLTGALQSAPQLRGGHGATPLNHMYALAQRLDG
jgi:hydroxymethylpyrimidine/phosphomethylpyrimidine kinase